MPSPPEIKIIRQTTAKNYSFDITSVDAHAADLAAAVDVDATALATATPLSGTLSGPQVARIADIERFNFGDIVDDATLRDRLIEQNLDDAIRFLQNCTASRKEYGDVAKLYLDNSLKSDEFFQLDDIHQEEVKAHLYEIPYKEAMQNEKAAESTLAHATAQKEIFGQLLDDARAVHASVVLAAQPYFEKQPNLYDTMRDNAKVLAEYRSRLELATWKPNELANQINLADLNAKLEISKTKKVYTFKDISFRALRANASRQLAYVQLQENNRPHSVLNYSERLANNATLFDLSARQLVTRVLALRRAASALYGIDSSLNAPARGTMVDRIAEWLLTLQDKIGRVRRQQKTSIFTVWLSSKVSNFDEVVQHVPFSVSVELKPIDTLSISGLLRGVAVEYLGTGERPLQLNVSPPVSATGRLSAANQVPTSLVFGRVSFILCIRYPTPAR